MAVSVQRISVYAGKTLGTIETYPDGKRVAKLWAGKDVGFYNPNMGANGATFSWKAGKYIASGDITSALVWMEGKI